MREDAGAQSLRMVRLDGASATPGKAFDVAAVAGRGRGTGMPQLVTAGGRAHLVWTEVVDGGPRLRGAIVDTGSPHAGDARR